MNKSKWLYLLLILSSCSQVSDVTYTHVIPSMVVNGVVVAPLFTPVTLIMYDQEQLDEVTTTFDKMIKDVHKAADRTTTYFDRTNIKTVNDSYGLNQSVTISDELFDMLNYGVELTKLTKGNFNLAMGSLIDAWDGKFELSSFENIDIQESVIQEALLNIPTYEQLDMILELNKNDKTVKFNQLEGATGKVILSLGGLAKGYAVDCSKEYLKQAQYPAIINAGTSSLATVFTKPSKKDWTMAIKAPLLYNKVEYLFTIALQGSTNMSTSSDSEQNFLIVEEDGTTTIRHHILDTKTGYSNNYHRQVTLYSHDANSTILDALSTAFMNCETHDEIKNILQDVMEYYDCHIEAAIIDAYENSLDQFDVYMTLNFKESLGKEISSKIHQIYSL